MRKFTFTIAVIFISTIAAFAQDYTIGVKFGPTISYVKASTEGSTNYDTESELKFLIGAFLDYQFKENYHFNVGVNYGTKNVSVIARSSQSISTELGRSSFEQEFIQLPLLLKLYTNEVFLDTKVYFNFGLIPEFRLNNSAKSENDDFIRELRSVDLSGNFGGGLELSIGVNTRIFAGLFYNHGFVDQMKSQNNAFDELSLKNRLFGLELGIKF